MDPLTLLGLGSAAYNFFNKPKFMQGPMGAGITALEEFGGFVPYAVNPTLGGINSLLGLADQFTKTNLPDFRGDILNPTISNLRSMQIDNYFKDMMPLPPLPLPQPTPQPRPERQTPQQSGGGGGNPYTMTNRPAPQKTYIDSSAYKGMGYTRGR